MSGKSPESAFIEVSSLISSPSKPISPRMISLDHLAGRRRRVVGIDRAVDDMRGHRHRQVGQRLERREIVPPRARRAAYRRVGSSRCVSAKARPCPGMCFMTGSTPPAIRPSAAARPSAVDDRGILAIGAVADDVAGALDRHVEHRQAIGADAEAQQIEGMQPRHQPGGAQAGLAVVAVERAERRPRRIVAARSAGAGAARGRPPGR